MFSTALITGKTGIIVAMTLVTGLLLVFIMALLRIRTAVLGTLNEATTKMVDRFVISSGSDGSLSSSSSGSMSASGSVSGDGGGGGGVASTAGRIVATAGTSAASAAG